MLQPRTLREQVWRPSLITCPHLISDHTCNPQLSAWLEAMHAAVRVYGLKLPNVVFNLNGKLKAAANHT